MQDFWNFLVKCWHGRSWMIHGGMQFFFCKLAFLTFQKNYML
jgi:hypothetical protein